LRLDDWPTANADKEVRVNLQTLTLRQLVLRAELQRERVERDRDATSATAEVRRIKAEIRRRTQCQ
jgi:hypothetical protein